MRRVLTVATVAMLTATIGLRGAGISARWWAHVEALASDKMEGRNTDSAGHKRAAEYVAAQFKASGQGELGSRYFAAHPTVPIAYIVANVNTEMFLPLLPLKMLMVLGLDESDLGGDIRATATAVGVTVQMDPEPQRNRFVRSDQYSFVKVGIPALAMKVGYDINTPEAAIAAKWTAERYHAPSDDLNQPIDFSAAGEYDEVVRDLVVRIADRPDRPKGNDTSFFKRFAN